MYKKIMWQFVLLNLKGLQSGLIYFYIKHFHCMKLEKKNKDIFIKEILSLNIYKTQSHNHFCKNSVCSLSFMWTT